MFAHCVHACIILICCFVCHGITSCSQLSKIYYSISDVGAYVWFMDMDPHSLVPPYFVADVEAALASQSDFMNVPTQSHAADQVD